MTAREYNTLVKALRTFNSDTNPDSWRDGMELLMKLKHAHERRVAKRKASES